MSFDIRDADWRADAACRNADTEIFYPGVGEAAHEAMALCRICPVSSECFQYALRNEHFGVWGGTSERHRRKLRRAAGISAHEYLEEASGW